MIKNSKLIIKQYIARRATIEIVVWDSNGKFRENNKILNERLSPKEVYVTSGLLVFKMAELTLLPSTAVKKEQQRGRLLSGGTA